MSRHTSHAGRLTIAASGSASNTLALPGNTGRVCIGVTLVPPAAFTGTITVQGAMGSETPQSLAIDGGTAITLAAGVSRRINFPGLASLKLASSGSEASARDVEVYVEHDT